MQKIILYAAIVLLSIIYKANAQGVAAIKNSSDWHYRGSKADSYEMGPDASAEKSSSTVYKIKSIKKKTNGFGTIMKTIEPAEFLGKTVKMTAYVKCENVQSWAGLWMRVDYYTAAVLAFDNMQRRPIKGTKDWKKYEVVLHVPAEATAISYGVLLNETGKIWFRDVNLEIVDESIKETGQSRGRDHKVISFETKAKAIGNEIKAITENEKKELKAAVELIDSDLEKGIITKERASELRMQKAEIHAAAIESKVSDEQLKLNQLVQDKVDGKVEDEQVYGKGGRMFMIGNNADPIGAKTEFNLTSMKVYQGNEDKVERQSKRTTSQIVFAAGLNNLVTNRSLDKSDFRYIGSHFYEWGLTYNSRILKNENLLHFKYGFSVVYNNLRPTDNRRFVVNGNQTNLEINPVHQEDSRFRTVSVVLPLHLEFDFSKSRNEEGKNYFKTHDNFRFGLGGYIGTNVKAKQIIKYENGDYESKERVRGDFNVNNFVYGLSSYIGYKATSLYLKYDLNPLFTSNTVEQNNVSAGIRFDFN